MHEQQQLLHNGMVKGHHEVILDGPRRDLEFHQVAEAGVDSRDGQDSQVGGILQFGREFNLSSFHPLKYH